jgi:hypothetical protein
VQPVAGTTDPVASRVTQYVWTPDAPNGVAGRSETFYTEIARNRDVAPIVRMGSAIVGGEVWVPVVWSTGPANSFILPFGVELGLLTVSRADLDAGRPRRRVLSGALGFLDFSSTVTPAVRGGAFFHFGHTAHQVVGLFNANATWRERELPHEQHSVARMLQAYVGMDTMGNPVDQVAFLLGDPLDLGSNVNLRVMWRTVTQVFPGPRLPFRRSDTPDPASFLIGSELYVIGAVIGDDVTPAPISDGGVDAAVSDGDDVDSGAVVVEGGVAPDEIRPLMIYSTPWGAGSGETWQVRGSIEPRVARAQVTAADATPMPGSGSGIGVTWVEFYPADTAGNGPRYVLYGKHHAL